MGNGESLSGTPNYETFAYRIITILPNTPAAKAGIDP